MARPSGPKNRAGGRWTEPYYRNFIKNQLRQATRKWPPLSDVHKKARTRRGYYLCQGCQQEVPASIKKGNKRKNNIFVDHINPIIDPSVGFTTWDECIERMFCEEDNLQVLCSSCHDIKTKEERKIATERRRKEKNG